MEIPTDDPAAALAFCRRLAGLPGPVEAPAERPEVSVVAPVYNEEEILPLFHERLSKTLTDAGLRHEIVLVNDGSSDRSPAILEQLVAADRNLVVVDLSRNFGHQVAISAGIDHATGDAVIVMDADLQDPPEVLPQFIARWQEGFDVVYAIREKRKESLPLRAAYAVFYRLLKRVASIDIPLDAGDFCLMDRRVADILRSMPERNRFVRGIRSWIGLRQTGLAYERQERSAGTSKYTFRKLLGLALDGLISFSYLPLRVITSIGFLVSGFSILLGIYYLIKRLTVGLEPRGFTTLIVVTCFLAGIQLVTIGVIGEYLGRVFEEVKRRPLYVVRRLLRQ